jgi:hypothetical protein
MGPTGLEPMPPLRVMPIIGGNRYHLPELQRRNGKPNPSQEEQLKTVEISSSLVIREENRSNSQNSFLPQTLMTVLRCSV